MKKYKSYVFGLPIVTTIIMVIGTSCKEKMTQQDFDHYRSNLFSAYCTNDVRVAEMTLLEDLNTLNNWESNHLSGTDFQIDYDACKALDHERLFLIYRKTYETNKMVREFQQSLEYLARSRHNSGEYPQPAIKYEEFANEIDLREHNANIRWKTNSNVQNSQ